MSEQSYRGTETLLAQLVSGETTSAVLVNHYLLCMTRSNKPLNAVVQQHHTLVLEVATRADCEWLERRTRGALRGLSYAAKEPSDVQGWLITSGTHYPKDSQTMQDVPSITRLYVVRAILMGKTDVPMMTVDWQAYNDLYDITHNLWDR